MTMMALALDIGSSAVRAFLYDASGTRRGGAKIPYSWHTTPEGGVEVDAELLLDRAARALDGAVAAARAAGTVPVAAASSALWHSVLAVAADGTPLTPVYSWSDMRAASDAAELRRELDEASVHARTGAMLHPSYLPARIRWIRRTHPAAGGARWWMSAAEWIELQLLGAPRVSISMASATGLFDQHRCDWDEEMLAAAGIRREQLPPLADLDEPTARLTPKWRTRWPELRDVAWLPTIGDGVAANVGSGCLDPTRIALSIGTSAALRVIVPAGRLEIPADLWCYRLDRARAVIGGALSNGGGVYRWLRGTLRLPDDETAIDAALAALPPDQHGLTVLPFWAGERSPHWPLHATATIEGLTTDTTPIAIMQASLEAVTYRLLYVRHRLAQHFPDAAMLVGSGTAVRESSAWAGMIADAFGESLTLADEDEASSRGAALLALVACGALRAASDAPVAVARVVQPDTSRTVRYAEGYSRHWALDATEVGERHTVRGGLV